MAHFQSYAKRVIGLLLLESKLPQKQSEFLSPSLLLGLNPDEHFRGFANKRNQLLPLFVVSEKLREWDEFSRTETSVFSDSDGESDYVTGLEDFPDHSTKTTCQQTKDMFEFLNNPSHTSSFIQSILYEDSCAGIAVVDLFVAVKIVKDKMDVLARCNNDLFEKISNLIRETGAIRTGYKNLIENMHAFLSRISETDPKQLMDRSRIRQGSREKRPIACNRSEASSFGLQMLIKEDDENYDQKQNLTESCRNQCHCCERNDSHENLFRSCSTEGGEANNSQRCWYHRKGNASHNLNCIGCILSIFGGGVQSKVSIRNEALIGSFIASLLWLQKRDKNFSTPRMNSKVISQIREEIKTVEGSLGISESKIQMISDICEILCGTESKKLESEMSDSRENVHGSKMAKREDKSSSQKVGNKIRSEESLIIISNSRNTLKSREDTDSDGESVFEEALAELSIPPTELIGNHNASCMGDLENDLAKKRNVSTFTTNSDAVPSWIDKLTDDIKSKIKKIKSKTNVTVIEKSYQKSNKTVRKLTGAFEFVITANTPIGVFDVTVLQYQKRRRSKDYTKKIGKLVQSFRGKESTKHRQLPIKTTNVKDDDYFLEDNLPTSDVESTEGSSNSGEDELEEFVDIYVKNSKNNVTPIRQKVESKISVLKLVKPPYFEIQKCYPTFFVQEIIRKTWKVRPPEQSNISICKEQKTLSLKTGKKQQKEMVIQRSSSDLVIYIQVEVEDGQTSSTGELFVEYQTNSLGTQTRDALPAAFPEEEKVIKLEEEQENGKSLYHIWREYEAGNLTEAEEKKIITFNEPLMTAGEEELAIKKEKLEQYEEKEVMVKESKEKTVTFNEVLSEISTEGEIEKTHPEIEEKENFSAKGVLKVMTIMNAKYQCNIWLLQNESIAIQRAEVVNPQIRRQIKDKSNLRPHIVNFVGPIVFSTLELEKALNLIREVENDVRDVKLSAAISILPRLESELRKHLQNKMKSLKDISLENENSVDNFFSAVDFWPYEHLVEVDSENSEEKLNSLLKLLSDLEEAVRANEYSGQKLELCKFNSSVIHGLLRALTNSIRVLEESPNVMSLSQTLDIASQLDSEVRKYDSVIKKQSLSCVGPETEKDKIVTLSSNCLGEVLVNEQLKNVRKKVFEKVEEEAIDMEGRIERDFDRLDRLEKENNEAMMFLEALLQKTKRRAAEFKDLQRDLVEMTFSVNTLLEDIVRTKEKKLAESKDHGSLDRPSKISTVPKNESVRETVSGLLIALDSLKTRVREKNEICKEILYSVGFDRTSESEKSSRRSSKSSFTAKQIETMTSTVEDFKKIGETSLYLSWTKPKASPSVSVLGYEIYVNGKLNQKVRNPQRLQAVLYSVDLSKEVEIHLYALVESESKVLIATVAYRDK